MLAAVTVVDIIGFSLAVIVAWALPGSIPLLSPVPYIRPVVMGFAIAQLFILLLLLKLVGAYDLRDVSVGSREYRSVIHSQALTAGLLGVIAYLFNIPISRTYFIVSTVLGTFFLLLGRFFFRRVIHRFRREGRFMRRVLIAGSPIRAAAIADAFESRPWLGLMPVATFLSADHLPSVNDATDTPEFKNLAKAVRDSDVEILVIADGFLEDSAEFLNISWALESLHVSLIVMPSLGDIAQDRIHARPVAGLPFVWIEQPRSAKALSWGKRVFDIAGASLGTLVLSPFLLLIAYLIKKHDGGPAFFSQTRIGRDGHPFQLHKFRTMVPNAEALRAQLVAEHGGEGLFKMADDPRVTPVGRFLRRHSLDEFPQLLNVFKGEMSLVGPRPALPEEVATYSEKGPFGLERGLGA
ncbi:hypothetical protein BSZ39_12755 [Bowdeniella nasicola]|uniref:Bacterial sugar transferase domain-containing protein n=1 Tax=Bowdeniella nasicola TaxID=208480 RepID=A0A1Q5PVM3_9ACTO|nr:exopolysaccharide biosynthesis polyprenyl glycosylphosphotransferase [Bowdeniella nasicola]OKL51485.1 hypothetical protein BSZ39_12755 [Bowdeniella nasicola]